MTVTAVLQPEQTRDALPVLRIQRSRGWVSLRLRELWEYRELLYFLVWRDLKVRYKQTVIGVAWAVFQPLMTMVVFTVIFGHLVLGRWHIKSRHFD